MSCSDSEPAESCTENEGDEFEASDAEGKATAPKGQTGDGDRPISDADMMADAAVGPAAKVFTFSDLCALLGDDEPPATLSASKQMQWKAKRILSRYVLDLLQQPEWRGKSNRVLIDQAMRNMNRDKIGTGVNWGMYTAYSRRRSLLDSFAKYEIDNLRKLMDSLLTQGAPPPPAAPSDGSDVKNVKVS